ncbi:hypothetical protein [Anaerotignum propionicum]|uniref:Uncharacterized protein n=1 Tax=Anaerotignum propionicum DSM 1682 TaxID=991789 RepID=A0A0X8VB41_ANAPI|nr:hypothetical protein [Anaerotignum propionicum]AMJ42347.1 hypothetical protein CPRO_28030 [Anaerotignum propionicum DSM 1682]SHF00109.1 hypothetical protein SAMN02745151_02459 [[Clostridium] propionicum DSM 1682] [Anaerotignum propionicum DSM 1682]
MRLLNEVAKTIVSVTAEKLCAMKQKENEIKAIYTPPVIENGVLVQMGSVKFEAPVTHVNNTAGIKWYEDKLVCQS